MPICCGRGHSYCTPIGAPCHISATCSYLDLACRSLGTTSCSELAQLSLSHITFHKHHAVRCTLYASPKGEARTQKRKIQAVKSIHNLDMDCPVGQPSQQWPKKEWTSHTWSGPPLKRIYLEVGRTFWSRLLSVVRRLSSIVRSSSTYSKTRRASTHATRVW